MNHVISGALLMACHIQELSDAEIELLMRALMFSGEILVWPVQWRDKMASLQSLGSTGNKAKLVLAPVMAACGLKVRRPTGHYLVMTGYCRQHLITVK